MPYEIRKNAGKCKGSKPYAVVNKDTGDVKGCHETVAKAKAQLKALYVNVKANEKGGDDSLRYGFWHDLQQVQFEEGWIQAIPYGTYYHPIHGEFEFDEDRLTRFRDNVNNSVRGQDLDIDYDHKKGTEGGKAAGWVKEAELRDNGLWIKVDFTDDATKGIKNKEWRYFSPDFLTKWQHPKTKEWHEDVLCGGALTNRPFLKDILPVNLSELGYQFDEDTPRDGRALTTSQVNYRDSKDDAFRCDGCQRYIEEGRTNGPGCSRVAGDIKPEGVCDIWSSNRYYYWSDEETGVKGVIRMGDENKNPQGDPTPPADPPAPNPEPTPTPPTTVQPARLTELQEENRQLSERIALLEVRDRTNSINTQLRELPAIPAAVHDNLRGVLMQLNEQPANALLDVLKQINKTGTVPLNEDGATRTGSTNDGGDSTKQFNDLVSTKMKDNNDMDYGAAVELVAKENPILFQEYRFDSYLRDPSAPNR